MAQGKKKRKRRRKLRWGRIIATALVLAGLCALPFALCSRHADPEPDQPQPEQAEAVEAINAAEAADAEAAEAPDDALLRVERALRAGDNPWDAHLPEMPDDGCVKMRINPVGGTLGKVFCDSNHLHLAAARTLGIKPIESTADAWHPGRPLTEVRSCRQYYVDDLSHSYPFLVPEAARLLHDIGQAFNDSLAARGGGAYRLKVTSILRTPLTVSKLRRVNANATERSSHQYGTTFDISYSKFIFDKDGVRRTQEDLKNLLAEVLYDLRARGRCYVKYERKQACFHITVRPGN